RGRLPRAGRGAPLRRPSPAGGYEWRRAGGLRGPSQRRQARCGGPDPGVRGRAADGGGATGGPFAVDPAYEPLPAYFEKQLRPALDGLLASAASAGRIRSGVDAHDLLVAVASLSATTRDD